MANDNKTYDANSLVTLKGLEAVRLRPGMYIGSTDNRGMHHLVWEIIDNAMDELSNGYGDRIDVVIYEDESVSVRDYGRGIPTGINKQSQMNGVELVFTQLHAGGKFENANYAYSGGLHGVGASVANALSEWCVVEVHQNGKLYRVRFESRTVAGKIISGDTVEPLHVVGKTDETGTFVHFLPDKRVFNKGCRISFETICKRAREWCYLNKGAHFTIRDKRTFLYNGEEKFADIKPEGGLAEFAKACILSGEALYPEPICIYSKTPGFEVDIAVIHNTGYDEIMLSYVNNIRTIEGGYHEVGFRSAWTKCFNDYARKKNVLKDKDDNFSGDDFKEGLVAIISVRLRDPQFEGQTKTKLGNIDVRGKVESVVTETLTNMMNAKDFKAGTAILAKAVEAQKARMRAKLAKDSGRLLKNVNSINLVGKLSNCSGKKPELNELFIVEGNSAGGSAKQGRDTKTQAILPLRGKPMNVQKKRLDQVLQNEELVSIINALGVGIADKFDIRNLNYHKVIILADADQDGAHIRAILITFFFRFMRPLIEDGHLYIGMPPLYKVEKGGKVIYAYDDVELESVLQEVGRGAKLNRYKGLGEMNPEQLWETTMNPANRSLIRVSIEDASEAEMMVNTLMGDDITARKNYINENANFNRVDDFVAKYN